MSRRQRWLQVQAKACAAAPPGDAQHVDLVDAEAVEDARRQPGDTAQAVGPAREVRLADARNVEHDDLALVCLLS